MQRRHLLMLMLAGCLPLAGCTRLAAHKAAPPIAKPAIVEQLMQQETSDHWKQRVELFQKEQSPTGGIVFCGDSITEGLVNAPAFADVGLINRGIGGDGLAGLLQRLDLSVVDLQPRKCFLLIGINDVVFSPLTLDDYRTTYDYLFATLRARCPRCEFYVQSMLPIKGKYAAANPMARKVNAELQTLAARHGMTYIDLTPGFCDEQGEMRAELASDGVHPNAQGYAIWRARIAPFLK